jgi:serine/threonine-protein kinase
MEAVEAIGRIAISQKQQGSIPYQPSSENRAKTEKFPQPAPPNPTPIEPDVPLKSERAVDYTKLRDLLATGKWKEADEETANKMLEAAGRTEDRWLRIEDIDRFPCEDLRTIDQLWVKYSNGRFGFSVQKRIYESLGGTREYDEKIWEAFGDRVGLCVNKKWLYYKEIKFNTTAQEGHLPVGGGGFGDGGGQWRGRFLFGFLGWVSSLASRIVECNI